MDALDRQRIANLFLQPMGIPPESDEAEALFQYLAEHGSCGVGNEGQFLSPLYRQKVLDRIEGFVAGWQAAQLSRKPNIIPFLPSLRTRRKALAA